MIGPRHQRNGVPNQDALIRFGGAYGDGMVVCDGMGSKPYADFGARSACKTIPQALQIWLNEPHATDEQLLRLIHIVWNMKVQGKGANDCATTCLFAFAPASGGEILLAQLGDGLAVYHSAEHGLRRLTPDVGGITNRTTALGVATSLEEWHFARIPAADDATILLATDGVSNDLLQETIGEFTFGLRDQLQNLTAQQRTAFLKNELQNWPRPEHSDDKTIALMWRGHSAQTH